MEWVRRRTAPGNREHRGFSSLSTSSTAQGAQRPERGPSPRGAGVAMLLQGEGHGSGGKRLRCRAGVLGRRLAASSGMRHGRTPQQAFPKRRLLRFPQGPANLCFCAAGVLVGNEEELLCWGFLKTLEDNREQGPKIFLSPRKIQSHETPSYLSQSVRPQGPFSARSRQPGLCEPDPWPARGSSATCLLRGGRVSLPHQSQTAGPLSSHLAHISQARSLQLLLGQRWSCLHVCLCWGSWDCLFTASSENKNQMTQALSGACSCA